MSTIDPTWLPWHRPTSYDERPCVRDDRTALTYREFGQRVEAVAEQFAGLGVSAGSVVAVMLPNRVELLVSIMAAWRLGAAATPVNPTFTATEAGHQIGDSGATLVVSSTSDPGGAGNAGVPVLAVDDLARTPAGTLPELTTPISDLALLVYTSGSTGKPKGVMLDHGNVGAMIASMGEAIGVTAEDHCLLVLPLFHVNAICVSFLTPLSVGAQLTVLQRFHPVEFVRAIEEFRPTFFSAVPTIYSHLVALPAEVQPDVSSVRFAICGAAPAPPELFAAVEKRFGFPMVEGYGLSEGTCASTCNPVDGLRKPGTVGPAMPGQLVAVMAPDGTLLPNGERGEVVIKGDNVMRGYLNRPEATAETLGDGWLHTGDVGILDDDGYLRIVDRIKDMIIRGGENIYPKEIENVLHSDPSVLEAAVVGGAHPVYGEVPIAFVAPEPGATIDTDALLARCREDLTKIKVPVAVHVLESLPKNPVGKIDKPGLRTRLAATAGKGA
ncbi:AMP-dependent synthetase [Nocardioides sp. Root190]|uniref:class I adenylate-forming enzyme family protein n=1 Tax=Nocardioides sp. Root190 TaxID=1736488 RepID=UPI0006F769F0|nr:AMP-binding protein [Nocardioides sp. Root190]KRB77957.1 AMP-dependent synthetase [Nocardioides sp. Root190]